MDEPTYLGQPPDQGRIVPGTLYPGEGYAVLKCGDTEVVLGFTLLHHLRFATDGDARMFAQIAAAQRALHAITCEASLGRTGDGPLIDADLAGIQPSVRGDDALDPATLGAVVSVTVDGRTRCAGWTGRAVNVHARFDGDVHVPLDLLRQRLAEARPAVGEPPEGWFAVTCLRR